MVIEKVGRIERRWARDRLREAGTAGDTALTVLARLQQSLRTTLLDQRQAYRLNRNDPLQRAVSFASLDALAEELWAAP